jgi:hypothetical protein
MAVGFADYLAALQREEHAARVYQRHIERILVGRAAEISI